MINISKTEWTQEDLDVTANDIATSEAEIAENIPKVRESLSKASKESRARFCTGMRLIIDAIDRIRATAVSLTAEVEQMP